MKNFGKGLVFAILAAIIFAGAFTLFGEKAEAKYVRASTVAANSNPTDLEIDLLTKEILRENRITRQGARKLHVGTTVRIPQQYGGTEYRLAKLEGRADCIWFLAEKTLRNQTPAPTWVPTTVVAPTPPEPVVASTPEPAPAEPNVFEKFWAWLTGTLGAFLAGLWGLIKLIFWIALVIGAIWILLWAIVRLVRHIQFKQREAAMLEEERRRMNPDSYEPVVRGGLSNNPTEAGPQIEKIVRAAYPMGPTVVRSERGFISNPNGAHELTVPMTFGDGQDRRVNIRVSDPIWRITLTHGDVLYARASCGNLLSGRFTLPRGWEFRAEPEMVYVAPIISPITPPPPPTPAPPVAPVTAVPAVTSTATTPAVPTSEPATSVPEGTSTVPTTTNGDATVTITITENGVERKYDISGDREKFPTSLKIGDLDIKLPLPRKEGDKA